MNIGENKMKISFIISPLLLPWPKHVAGSLTDNVLLSIICHKLVDDASLFMPC